jgi:hypothetical protein
MSHELKFASTSEALQHLADETGQKIIIAGWWTDAWTTMGIPLTWMTDDIKKEYFVMKRAAVALVKPLSKLGELLGNNSSPYMKNKDIADWISQLKNTNTVITSDSKKKDLIGKISDFTLFIQNFLTDQGKTEDPEKRKLYQQMQNNSKIIKEGYNVRIIAERVQEAYKKLDKKLAEEFQKNKTQKSENYVTKALHLMKQAVGEELSKVKSGKFGDALGNMSRAALAFDDEQEAIQHLSDLTNSRVVIKL